MPCRPVDGQDAVAGRRTEGSVERAARQLEFTQQAGFEVEQVGDVVVGEDQDVSVVRDTGTTENHHPCSHPKGTSMPGIGPAPALGNAITGRGHDTRRYYRAGASRAIAGSCAWPR